jgi:putative peptide zinc metalloprotease protein
VLVEAVARRLYRPLNAGDFQPCRTWYGWHVPRGIGSVAASGKPSGNELSSVLTCCCLFHELSRDKVHAHWSTLGMSTFPRDSATTLSDERATAPIGLLEGTELVGEFKSSGYREASRLVGRSDGRLVRLSTVLYAVVTVLDRHAKTERMGGREMLSRVAEEVRDKTGLELTSDHIAYLMDQKLAPLGITTNSNGSRPAVAESRPFLSLRFKKAVLPSSATWFIAGLFSWLFYPAVVVAVVAAALASEIWLFGTQPMGSALAQALADPTSVLLVGGLAVASSFFHELGHATGCRYSGARPGPIGCGVYLVWPVFYTDISNTYRLERSGRLRAVLGGVYFNALFIIGITLLYVWTGYPVLLAVVLIANLELMQQLLPTLRFDGYFIVSDLVGVPDLFKYIGPILKRTVLRQPADERLKALKTWPQRIVTVWVLVVIPALIAQLTFIVFQLPQFVTIGWEKIKAIASRTDFLGLMGDVALTVFALLPLAGLTVLVLQAARGITHIVRRTQTDVGEPADFTPSPQALPNRTPSKRWPPRALAISCLVVFNAALLVTGAAYILSGRGSRSTPSASPSPSGTVSEERVERPPFLPHQTTTTVALPTGNVRIATVPLSEAVQTFSVASRSHTNDPVTYPQTPPVGGPHTPTWEACVFHGRPIATEKGVHSLEHGAIWITYRPDLPADQVDVLARMAGSRRDVLVSRWDNGLPAPVVVSSWGRQLRLTSATDPRLVQFAEAFSGQAPEPNAPC